MQEYSPCYSEAIRYKRMALILPEALRPLASSRRPRSPIEKVLRIDMIRDYLRTRTFAIREQLAKGNATLSGTFKHCFRGCRTPFVSI